MSAFILNHDHIDLLNSAAQAAEARHHLNASFRTEFGPTMKAGTDEYGRALLDANVKAVCGLYDQIGPEERADYDRMVESYKFRLIPVVGLPKDEQIAMVAQIANAISCYLHQTDSIEGFTGSWVEGQMQAIAHVFPLVAFPKTDPEWVYVRS